MMHGVTLITTIAAGFGLALILGFVAVRLGLPALIGYLLAGVVLGPATPGYVADLEIAGQLAEIGVMLLMFGVGLHFSFQDLLSVRRIALPGAIVQIAVATALGAGLATLWGWNLSSGIVFGFALSVASTVVLLRALEARGELETVNGRIAVGWLVVEDLVTVLVLVLMPPLAAVIATPGSMDGGEVLRSLAMTVGEIGVFIALMLVVGRRLFPWLLWQVARTGSRELFTLCVIAAALGIAYGSSALFGASFALGAFFAGMVLRESDLSYRAAQESLPLRDAFSVLFFVSVGMLFDPAVVLSAPAPGPRRRRRDPRRQVARGLPAGGRFPLSAQHGAHRVGKPRADRRVLLHPRRSRRDARSASGGRAEFHPGRRHHLHRLEPDRVPDHRARGALVAAAGGSRPLARTPAGSAGGPAGRNDAARVSRATSCSSATDGWAAGSARRSAERGLPFVVVEQNRELVEKLREQGVQAVAGDASDPAELAQAHIARARMLVIAIPDAFQARQMIEAARTLNPGIETVVRTHSEEEAELLRKENAGKVFMGEHELAVGMTRHVLERVAPG